MAGDNAKSSTNKQPSSSERKSRWQSSSPATAPATATATATTTTVVNPEPGKPSKSTPASTSNSKLPNRPPSDKSNRRPNPNPTPAQPNPSPTQNRGPIPPGGQPAPPPSYGFHMLDRRTIVLADGSVRSYFGLPLDYQDLPPPRPPIDRFLPFGPMSPDRLRDRVDLFGPNRGSQEYWNSLGLDGRGGPDSIKRKFGDGELRERDDRDELARRRQKLLQYGNVGVSLGTGPSSPFKRDNEFGFPPNYMRIGGGDRGFETNLMVAKKHEIDPAVLKASLNFAKLINENASQKKNYLDNGKHGPLRCLACRSSNDFPDMHSLILHTYNSDNADLQVDHLGLHRALCILMGWNYLRTPDNSKVYQFLPSDEAAANLDDLILWPPTVIIHNTNTGKGKDGRMEGLGNKNMDNKMRELGFPGGKSKALYCRDGHLGITLVKFASDQSGLKEAMRLSDHFEQGSHGRRHWAHLQSLSGGKDDESNPNLEVVDERTGERRRVLYGYLGTAFDLDKLDFETRKKIALESKHEKIQPLK